MPPLEIRQEFQSRKISGYTHFGINNYPYVVYVLLTSKGRLVKMPISARETDMKPKKRAEKQLSFADQIREAVRASGVSQYRIWKETGLDQAMLSRFLSGERWPSEDNLNTLARYLDLKVTGQKPAQGDD